MKAGTIIAHNYLAYARVLAASYARHHPGKRLCVLVIDGEATPFRGEGEPFDTVLPRELPLPADEFRRMAGMYDVMELATAVKPFFLRLLLDRGAGVAMFLDPDIEVFAPLDEIARLGREHGIVLVPHMLRPIPADGRKPTHADIAGSGVYNLGFIAVSPGAGSFLEWWGRQLRRDCLVAPEEHLFVDQRVLDFLPGYERPYVVRDPAYDVAYWNLHERQVAWTGARYEVEGAPLRFFHFSGFDPTTPHLLSKHQGTTPRVLLSEAPDLARLCGEYAQRLLQAGYAQCAGIPYGFGRTADGVPLDRRMRRLYREGLLAAERGDGAAPPAPLDPAEAAAFVRWLDAPVDGSRGPSRYLRRVYEERADLRMAFPDLSGADLARYLDWVRRDGRAEPPVPAIFRAAALRSPAGADGPVEATEPATDGVNIAGYVRAELGIGEGARLTLAAVKAAGLPYAVVPFGETASRQQHPFDDLGGRPVHDVNLVQVNADMFPRFAEQVGRTLLAGRYTVGIWAWEVESFPAAMAAAERHVDEIWAVSRFAAAAIGEKVSRPVFSFPHPVIPPTPPRRTRAELGLAEAFTFLFCFDFFSVMERKNPAGLIEAFCRAFRPGEGPVLVIKTINGERVVEQLERLRALAAERPDIRIVDGYRPLPEVHALMDACDAYVSLHRGEGFGLTLAEAMALGKPVIATGYSGNLEFMNEDNSYLVPFTLTAIPQGCDPYPAGACWAAPDLGEAARLMRRVYEHRDEGARLGQRARDDMARLHSPEARVPFLRARLAAIRQARPAAAARRDAGPASGASGEAPGASIPRAAAAELSAIAPPLGSRHAPVRFVQRVLLRLLRPLLNHQRAIVHHLVEAMADVERTLDARRQEGLEALARTFEARVASAQAETRGVLESLERAVHDGAVGLEALTRAVDDLRRHGDTRLDALHRLASAAAEQVQGLGAELRAAAYVWDPSLVSGLPDASGRPTLGYHSATGGPSASPYLRFEDIFRGPEALIRERQRPYIGMLGGRRPVLDVGCGRGELLDLCREAGIPAVGVDSDAGMVERCRAKGHQVECADALAYLGRQKEGSLGAIISMQFIEHLPYESLLVFLRLSYRALDPDGRFVAETVNPHSIQAFKAFWTDLTHQRPIFPETLLALCRLQGFEEASVFFPGGTGDVQADRWSRGDYAVVARRGVAVADGRAPTPGA